MRGQASHPETTHGKPGWTIWFTPSGVFAVAASAAGTMTIKEFGRVQVYLLTYTLAVLGLCFWLLPTLIASCTPFSRREIWLASRDALVTAFATGKVLAVLPMLIENTKLLLKRRESRAPDAAETVEVLYIGSSAIWLRKQPA